MTILIFLIISYILLCFSLSKLFPKANVDATKAWIPGVNFVEWCKIVGRPKWHAFLLLIPVYNFFVFWGMCVDMVKSFGKYELVDSALAVIYAPFAFYKIANNDKDTYVGPAYSLEKEYAAQIKEAKKNGNEFEYNKAVNRNPFKKSGIRDLFESVVFAVFAATFIRMFLIEAFVIPTPSMEGSLNVGDFLFVSKAHYGIRTPETVLQLPLVHNRMPGNFAESYLEKPNLPFTRLPAIQPVQRNKPFVFNWPAGDSIYYAGGRSWSAGQVRRRADLKQYVRAADLITRPIDKRDHYVKRCVAIAGDKIQIKDRQLYINDAPAENPEHLQFNYDIVLPEGANVNLDKLDDLGIDAEDRNPRMPQALFTTKKEKLALDNEQVATLKEWFPGISIEPQKEDVNPLQIFPNDPKNFNTWSIDNFGPLNIPKKGETVTITPKNIALYSRIIDVYENNDLEIKNGRILVNGTPTTNYTFKQDYYWAMGDNRHNSEDSRMWGFVPMDHIVGKPMLIWMSWDEGGINWDRIFKRADNK